MGVRIMPARVIPRHSAICEASVPSIGSHSLDTTG